MVAGGAADTVSHCRLFFVSLQRPPLPNPFLISTHLSGFSYLVTAVFSFHHLIWIMTTVIHFCLKLVHHVLPTGKILPTVTIHLKACSALPVVWSWVQWTFSLLLSLLLICLLLQLVVHLHHTLALIASDPILKDILIEGVTWLLPVPVSLSSGFGFYLNIAWSLIGKDSDCT